MDLSGNNHSFYGSEPNDNKALREHVLGAIDNYFDNMKSNGLLSLHTLILEEIESAMYESAMKFTKGNQVQAAKVLGVARGTLRTKLKQYFGTTQVGGLYHKYTIKPLTKAQHPIEV